MNDERTIEDLTDAELLEDCAQFCADMRQNGHVHLWMLGSGLGMLLELLRRLDDKVGKLDDKVGK